jgi:hypothetical protein
MPIRIRILRSRGTARGVFNHQGMRRHFSTA